MNDPTELREEAHHCRETALDYLGRPEAPFLLRVAQAFEELASKIDGDPPASAEPPRQ